MTNQGWKAIEDNLSIFSPAKFKIDGHDVTIQVERSKMKLYYMIYIDGEFRGEWLDKDKMPQIVEKLYWKRRINAYTPKEKKDYLKIMGKRALKRMDIDLDAHTFYYTPCFYSFRTLKATWKKNCERVEVVKDIEPTEKEEEVCDNIETEDDLPF